MTLLREARMFPTMLRVGFAELVAFRGEVFIWILTTTMPLIMYAMWSTIAREAPVGRFDEGTFASYFLSTLVVRQLTSAWIVWELNFTIRNGGLSTVLIKPVHPLLFYAAQNLGALPFRALVLFPIAALAYVVIPGIQLEIDALHLGLYVATTFLAWLLTFLIQSMFGLLALYTQQSLSFQEAWFGLWALLSGYLIPLELIPRVQAFANWLPFRSMGSLPTEILLGHLEGAALVQGVATQAAWVALCFIVVRLVWDRAIRRFEAYGG
jgi:ABC-2 type transport system permease protein